MKTIFYAVSNSALHLFLTEKSLQSLRCQNQKIRVKVFTFGNIKPTALRKFEKFDVEIINLPKIPKSYLPASFLKWFAVANMTSKRALYVDSDTLFFKDPLNLFSTYKEKDFYARQEYGTRPQAGFQLLGNLIMEPQIHPKKFKAISKLFDFKPQPVFNNGVMLFNHGFTTRIAQHLNEMIDFYQLFKQKPAYYPAENFYIADEVIASIVFGRLKYFSYGKISKEVSPWYCEWKAGVVSTPGVVMHAWTKYSPFFIREFIGDKIAAQLPILIPAEKEYSEF